MKPRFIPREHGQTLKVENGARCGGVSMPLIPELGSQEFDLLLVITIILLVTNLLKWLRFFH